MALKLDTLFNQKSFDRVFIRQPDGESCTPAACATIARLYDMPPDWDIPFFRRVIKCSFDGSYPDNYQKALPGLLSATRAGVDVYDNGIALAGIRHKPTGLNHSVVFLAKKNAEVIYYDPCDHKIYIDNVRNMQRGSQKTPDERWTANMPHIKGATFSFCKRLAVPNPYRLRDQTYWLKEHGYKNFPT